MEDLLGGRFTREECHMLFVRTKVRWALRRKDDPEDLMERIGIATQGRITRPEAIKVLLYVVLGRPFAEDETAERLYAGLLKTIGLSGEGTDQDEMPEGKGMFGLEATNPIPVRGIPEKEVYLSRLRLPDGSRISWERLGSTHAANIPNIIDAYAIMDQTGGRITTLFLCAYNQRTSKRAPEGFVMAE